MPYLNRVLALLGLHLRRLLFLVGLHLFWYQPAVGQDQRPPVPQFSFMQLRLVPINLAARPASLGGAFIGIADDATAAAINPAGLGLLSRPEASLNQALGLQARHFPVDRREGENGSRRETQPVFDQTFVNLVYSRWGFTFAMFRQVAFRSEFDFSRRQFLTIAPARPLTIDEQLGASGNFPGVISEFSSEVIHNAIGIAKALNRRFRLAFTARLTQFRIQLHERHFFDPSLWQQTAFNGGEITIGDNRVEGLYRIYHLKKNAIKPSWSVGMVAELHRNLTLGAVYQNLPAFQVDNWITLPAYSLPDRTPTDGHNDEINFKPEEKHAFFTINLPDILGLGVAWKPSTAKTLAFDVLFYRNGSLLRGLVMNLPYDDKPTGDGRYIDPDGRDDVEVKDVFSFHGGVEYVMIKRKFKLPLRLGFYTEPNFGPRAVSSDVNVKREYPDESVRFHFTWGLGLLYFKNVRIDGSMDISSTVLESIASAVVSF